MPAKKQKDPVVVIGIDFGTTFSGVSWARSTRPDRHEIITNWKAASHYNTDKEKAPTTVAYKSTGPSWGYSIPPTDVCMKWFKLLLIDENDLPEDIRKSSRMSGHKELLKDTNKTVVEVISDFLRALWAHALENIQRSMGQTMLELSKLKVIVTLPAIWPHYAQLRMREAIQLAGILDERPAGLTSLDFISEPEAAALATMEDIIDRPDIKVGDHFVVCDAGGGTVVSLSPGSFVVMPLTPSQDIITYTVVKTKPMTVRESVQGKGDLCGAVFLDERFTHLLQSLMPTNTWQSLGVGAIQKLINDEWEHGIKPSFVGENEDGWEIVLPHGAESKYHPPIKIHRNQILSVYRPIITRIENLVKDQIAEVLKQHNQLPKFVILVGGFGKSVYLHKCLEKAVDQKIEVLQGSGERPWTAVCRGAVMRGLAYFKLNKSMNVAIQSRISRRSYGTVTNIIPFDPADHAAADRAWCEVNQAFVAVDQAFWFLEIGEALRTDEPIKYPVWQDTDNPNDEFEIELVVSDAPEPPKRKDSTVRTLCTIRFAKIPDWDKLPTWRNTEGKEYRRLQYELSILCDGTSLDVGVYKGGRRFESQNVSVDFTSDKDSN